MDYNEWLLHDRLYVIKDVLLASQCKITIILTNNILRDIVLKNLLLRAGVFTIEPTKERLIEVSALEADENETTNEIQCIIKDEEGNITQFFPLKVCNQEWIEWYVLNKMS